MDDDVRPPWPHKIPEEVARWLAASFVVRIDHQWKMTGVDTSHDWLVFYRTDGESREFPTAFAEMWPEVHFSPNHASLVRFKPYPDVRATLDQINAWEKKNARDRSEFERLKRKFVTSQ